MDFDKFIASRQDLPLKNGETAICYLGTHLSMDSCERIWINKKSDVLFSLEIENQQYSGDFFQLEKILWEWCFKDQFDMHQNE